MHPYLMSEKDKDKDKDILCQHCGTQTTKIYLSRHIKSVHPDQSKQNQLNEDKQGNKNSSCKLCVFETCEKNESERHTALEHGKLIQCTQCNHKAADKISLKEHVNLDHPRFFC